MFIFRSVLSDPNFVVCHGWLALFFLGSRLILENFERPPFFSYLKSQAILVG